MASCFDQTMAPIRANCRKLAEGATRLRVGEGAIDCPMRKTRMGWHISRLPYHGVETLADGDHPVSGRCRVNLTFPKVA